MRLVLFQAGLFNGQPLAELMNLFVLASGVRLQGGQLFLCPAGPLLNLGQLLFNPGGLASCLLNPTLVVYLLVVLLIGLVFQ